MAMIQHKYQDFIQQQNSCNILRNNVLFYTFMNFIECFKVVNFTECLVNSTEVFNLDEDCPGNRYSGGESAEKRGSLRWIYWESYETFVTQNDVQMSDIKRCRWWWKDHDCRMTWQRKTESTTNHACRGSNDFAQELEGGVPAPLAAPMLLAKGWSYG